MIALVDINNCYVSCERVFNPKLRDKPVVVLSNNDGCVISRSNEAKKLGVKMAVPTFQIEELKRKYDIQVFSSNYELYGDMSTRLMATLNQFTPEMEIYSIDEAFIDLTGFEHLGLKEYGEKITQTVLRNTGLPVSMGIGPTKTLAKVANKFAKKYPRYNSVCLIDNEEKRIKALQLTNIADVWGIGRRNAKKLQASGIKTAYEFTQLNQKKVRSIYTVVGEQIWLELQGIRCYEIEKQPASKKQICTSRSFGRMVTDYEELKEAVATYAAVCASELREQNIFAISLMAFIHTNSFNKNDLQYSSSKIIQLPFSNNSTPYIIKYALQALKDIYKPGYRYKKAGVIITETTQNVQTNLFHDYDYEKDKSLMKVIDKYNKGFNNDKVKLAIQGTKDNEWKIKRNKLSPRYTTNIEEVIRINCKI